MSFSADLFNFRGYVLSSVLRDFNLRYRGSLLGAAIVFIVPAFQIAIYAIVFGTLLKGKLPSNDTPYAYTIYLCTGIMFWNFFSELLQRSQGLFLDNANLLKKVSFPFSILPVINLISCAINFFLSFVFVALFSFVFSTLPAQNIILLLPVLIVLSFIALCVGVCLAILQVFFRDIGAITPIALQGLFWCTPIVYPVEVLPGWVGQWLVINPLFAPFVTAQSLMLGAALPDLKSWSSTFMFVLLVFLFAVRLYKKHRADLMDNI